MKNTKKLPKRFKEKWVKALRSGKYLQTTASLYDKNTNDGKGGFCCLGVAGAISGISLEALDKGGLLCQRQIKNINNFPIPDLIKGEMEENPIVDKLTSYNDSGKSFKWIAAYIERYL